MITTAPADANSEVSLGKGLRIKWYTENGSNYPDTYGFLITIGITSTVCSQLFISLGWKIYIRQYASNNWAVWKMFTAD